MDSHGFSVEFQNDSYGFPVEFEWNPCGVLLEFRGHSMGIPLKFQSDSKWNLSGSPMTSKFNHCKIESNINIYQRHIQVESIWDKVTLN